MSLSISAKNKQTKIHAAEACRNADYLCICTAASLLETNSERHFLACKCHQLRHIVCVLPLQPGLQLYPCLVFGHQDWVPSNPLCSGLSHTDRQKPSSQCSAAPIPLYPSNSFCERCAGDFCLPPFTYFTFLLPASCLISSITTSLLPLLCVDEPLHFLFLRKEEGLC